ncbi:rhomboid family intramembrane serine protease [soil metagenome]
MALPFRDDLPTRRFPWVTLALMVINVVVFVFVQPSAFQNSPDPSGTDASFTREVERAQEAETYAWRWGAVPCETFSGEVVADAPDRCESIPSGIDYPEDKSIVAALLTCMFLHGNLLHLGGNMLFLWVFGNNVEDRLGRVAYLGLYLGGGVAATLGYAAVNPSAAIPLIGASGAIAAAMGAYLVLHPRARILTAIATAAFQVVYVPAAVVLVLYFVTQFFTAEEFVAWEAHVAGMLAGFVGALVLGRLASVRRRAEADRAERSLRSGTAF